MVLFCTEEKQGLGRWGGLSEVMCARPSPDYSAGALPHCPTLLRMRRGLLFCFSTWTSRNGIAGWCQTCLEAGLDAIGLGPPTPQRGLCSWARVHCFLQATAHRQRS